MGDIECDFCDIKSSTYIVLPLNGGLICKGCILRMVDEINDTILRTPDIRMDGFCEEKIDKETVKIISSL